MNAFRAAGYSIVFLAMAGWGRHVPEGGSEGNPVSAREEPAGVSWMLEAQEVQ